MRNFYRKRAEGVSSMVRLVIVDFIRLMLIVMIAISIINNRNLVLTVAILGFVSTFLPWMLKRFFNIRFPAKAEVIILLFIYGVLLYSGIHNVSFVFWWWNILLKFGAAIILGFVMFTVMFIS